MAGTYRDDRRKSGGRIASSLRDAGKKAARAFFGASPTQKKKLRKTVDKRGVKLNTLDLDGLDRSKFNAPEKVGESVKLIDIAMGNAPAGPAPGLAPPPPPLVPERAPRRPTASRPRTAPGPAVVDEEEEGEDEEGESSGAGPVTGLSSLLALACLVFVLAGAPFLRVVKPELVLFADSYREVALLLGLLFTWVAMSLGRLRAPRGGFVSEVARAMLFASLPAVVGAALLLWSCGALPSLGWPAPPEVAQLGASILTQVAPVAEATGLLPTHAAAACWAIVCLVLALLVRRLAARAEPTDE